MKTSEKRELLREVANTILVDMGDVEGKESAWIDFFSVVYNSIWDDADYLIEERYETYCRILLCALLQKSLNNP